MQCPEPAPLCRGVFFDPRADRLDDEDVGKARDDRLTPDFRALGLRGDESKCVLDPRRLRGARRLDMDDRRQEPQQFVRGGMVETNDAANQARCRATAAMADDGVAVADLLVVELVDPRARHVGIAGQAMPLSPTDERQVPLVKESMLAILRLEPAAARRHNVELAVLHGWQNQRPRRAELRTAVKDSAHPQEMKGGTERVYRSGGLCASHGFSMRLSRALTSSSRGRRGMERGPSIIAGPTHRSDGGLTHHSSRKAPTRARETSS